VKQTRRDLAAITAQACMLLVMTGMIAGLAWGKDLETTAYGQPAEGDIGPFMGEPRFDEQRVFKGGRGPNVVVATDGTVLATCGSPVKLRRSEDGGKTWGEPIDVGNGHVASGNIVNEVNGDVFIFSDPRGQIPLTLHRSSDDGKTWEVVDFEIKPDPNGNVPAMAMNDHGVTLRYGKYAGRLIRPARVYNGKRGYTTAIYSDDNGKTWESSDPFPEIGTGEATLVGLSDGSIYYNTRRHWAPKGKNPRRRWHGWSYDGGKTWQDVSICEVLPDGPQHSNYGLMGGLARLPVKGVDILVFSNINPPAADRVGKAAGRQNGHVWASFDGGRTWPVMRQITDGPFGYSSTIAGRPDTASEAWIYTGYENNGMVVARFNLGWLIDVGEGKAVLTGDGEIPGWLTP